MASSHLVVGSGDQQVLAILPDAGHYPMFESPVSLATSIKEFLGRD